MDMSVCLTNVTHIHFAARQEHSSLVPRALCVPSDYLFYQHRPLHGSRKRYKTVLSLSLLNKHILYSLMVSLKYTAALVATLFVSGAFAAPATDVRTQKLLSVSTFANYPSHHRARNVSSYVQHGAFPSHSNADSHNFSY